jgi:hypothetical protein
MPADQTRRLLRVKDSIDARYAEPLNVRDRFAVRFLTYTGRSSRA